MSEKKSEFATNRSCFEIDGQIYVSAGVIAYTVVYDKIFLMLQKLTEGGPHNPIWYWRWEDFGGRSNLTDSTIQDVAVRECIEELNFKLSREFIETQLGSAMSIRYLIPECKYAVYLMYIEPEKLDMCATEQFGTVELHDNIARTVHWIGYHKFIELVLEGDLHPRIQQRALAFSTVLLSLLRGSRAPTAEQPTAGTK